VTRIDELRPAAHAPAPRVSLAIFALAFALRLIHLLTIRGNPFFAHPIMDPLYHDEWALSLAQGEWLGHEPFFRAPLYPYFLGVVYAVFGHDFLAPRIIQIVLGSVTCVLVYLLGRRVFGERAGITAGVLAAIYPLFLYFDAELLINVLENLLYVLALLLILRAVDRAAPRGWLLAGLAVGAGAIARPTILTVAVAAVPWIVFALRDRGRGGRPDSTSSPATIFLALAVFAVGIAVPILPVTAYNVVRGGDTVLIASQGGLNFYLGNNPNANGWSATAPEFPKDWWGGVNTAAAIAERAAGRELHPSEIDRYWYGRAFDFWREHPGAALQLLGQKLAIFWTDYEFGNNKDYYFFRRYAPMLRLPLTFGVIGALSLVGMALFTRTRQSALLAIYVVVYMATIVAFFVCDKLRLPVVPVLMIFAAAALVRGFDLARARRWPPLAGGAAAVALLAVPMYVNWLGLPRPDFALSYAAVGAIHLEEGRLEEAERAFRQCLAINPTFPSAHLNLGSIMSRQGRFDEAAREYELELGLGNRDAMTLGNLGSIYQVRKEYERAIPFYREALSLDPGAQDVRYNLAQCLVYTGENEEAVEAFREVLRAVPNQVRAWNDLGVALRQLGRYDEAREAWQHALALDPNFTQARQNIEALGEGKAAGR